MKTFVIVCAAVVMFGLAQGHELNSKKCRTPTAKMTIDFEKFKGDWFTAGKIKTDNAPRVPDATCCKKTFTYKTEGNVTKIVGHITLKTADKDVKYIARAQPLSSSHNSVSYAVWKKEGADEKWSGVFTKAILATDYDNYAVVYACHPLYVEKDDTFDKIEILEIMSRKPQIEPKLFEVLKTILNGYDFNIEDMKTINNSNC